MVVPPFHDTVTMPLVRPPSREGFVEGSVKRLRLSSGAALVAASALLILAALPAAALTVKGEGHYARFQWGVGRGALVVVDRENGTPRVNAYGGGPDTIPPTESITFIFRSIDCDGTPAPDNRLYRTTAMTDENGAFVITRALSSSINFDALKSFWITFGDDDPECANALNFEKYSPTVHGPDSDGGLGVVMKSGGDHVTLENFMAVVEDRPAGGARVSVALGDFDGDSDVDGRDYLVSVSPQPCSVSSGSSTASFSVNDVVGVAFKAKAIDLSQAELDSLRSVRVKDKALSEVVCTPLSLMALLLP